MDIHTAVMKAADHIENHPGLFSFAEVRTPNDCGTPGCALGWIGYFAGQARWSSGTRVCHAVAHQQLGLPTDEREHEYMVCNDSADLFYGRMDELRPGWKWRADICADALRAYAAKYLAPEKPQQQPPNWQEMAERLAAAAPIGEAA